MPASRSQSRAIIGSYVFVVAALAVVFALQAQTLGALRQQADDNCRAISAMSSWSTTLATTSRQLFRSKDVALLHEREVADRTYLENLGSIAKAAHCIALKK